MAAMNTRRQPTRRGLAVRSLAALVLASALLLTSQTGRGQEGAPDPLEVGRHFTVDRPADLSNADALSIYRRIRDDMVSAYGLSQDPGAQAFIRWRAFNASPYRSRTHGERFVNNYGNGRASPYGLFEDAGDMPVGAILAKDSFTVTASGDVFTGPLFLMEKMPAGFNAGSRDWRYTMIMPDGSLFGRTDGPDGNRVAFCIDCHRAAGDDSDHLFFVPREFRNSSAQ